MNVDSGEVRFTKPTDKEREEHQKLVAAFAKLAKIWTTSKKGLAGNLAKRLGTTVQEALNRNKELQAAAELRRLRGACRRAKELQKRALV